MDKIKRFIECLVPVTACNLKCEYCYIIQQSRRANKLPKFEYSPEYIGKALSKERLGGVCLISLTGAGETLLPREIPLIVEELLKQGHYVNITTNGTLSKKFDELLKMPKDLLERLHFSFSLHYLELKKMNLVNTFFENVKKVKNAGCSILVQFNLYDGYYDSLDEIKELCLKEVGALPQVAATREECRGKNNKVVGYKLYTNNSNDSYKEIGDKFDSPLFDMTMRNFNVKRKEFCYAGDWSFILDLATGDVKRCYFEGVTQNIYKDLSKPIVFRPIGNNCRYQYCVNSSHFMSLGIIPESKSKSYGELRNREQADWYSDKMKSFLNTKLCESNKEYSFLAKTYYNVLSKFYFLTHILKKIIEKGKQYGKKFKN